MIPIKKNRWHIAVYRCLSKLIAVMSSQRCRKITIKTTVANSIRVPQVTADNRCVRVVMSRLGNCRV